MSSENVFQKGTEPEPKRLDRMSDGSTTSAAQHNLLSLSEIQANAANPVMQAKVHSSGNEQDRKSVV